MKQKILGIIGGLGPETSSKFCLQINRKVKPLTKIQPHIILDNLAISAKAEQQLIQGGASQEHLQLMLDSVHRLNKMDVDFIVIPCNTVHVFIEELQQQSKAPIINLIEEAAKQCKKLKVKKIGILGSTKTIETRLHQRELEKISIVGIVPDKEDQKRISNCIIKIINNQVKSNDKQFLLSVIEKLKKNGAEAILLACTELPSVIKQNDCSLSIMNTTEILEAAAVQKLIIESPHQ